MNTEVAVEHGIVEGSAERDRRRVNLELRSGIMPAAAPKVAGLEIAVGTMLEEEGLGDTVWDSFALPDGRTALACLHVRDAGQPPAVTLAMAKLALRAHADAGASVGQLLARANDTLIGAGVGRGGEAVDVAVLTFGVGGGNMEWAGAGRVSAAIIRRAGVLDPLPSHGPSLGVMAGFRYGASTASLSVGDSVLALSHASEGLFRGAADLVASLEGRSGGDTVETLYRALRRAQSGVPMEVSVLLLRKRE